MQVNKHIHYWRLQLSETLEEEEQLAQKLQQSQLQPTTLQLSGHYKRYESAGDALAAAGLNSFMEQVHKVTVRGRYFSLGIAQVGQQFG
jgi:hypothetical protein